MVPSKTAEVDCRTSDRRDSLFVLPDIDFARIFISFAVLLFSLTVHEASHAFVASALGDPTARLLGRVSLNPAVHLDPIGTVVFPLIAMLTGFPLLGWARPVPVSVGRLGNPRRDYMFVAAAGPAANLVLAILSSVALAAVAHLPGTVGTVDLVSPLAALLLTSVYVNVLLAVFNMVPIPPLDGGTVLAGLLPPRVADGYDRVVRPYGFLLLYALMFTGGLTALLMPPSSFLLEWLL